MASATGIPEQNPASSEQEPLLGRPGDATQKQDQALYFNLWNGTGILAQVGVWILAAIVWVSSRCSVTDYFSDRHRLLCWSMMLCSSAFIQYVYSIIENKRGVDRCSYYNPQASFYSSKQY